MTRGRIFTFVALVLVSGVALSLLMAAKAAGDKAANPPDAKPVGKRLVFFGDVTTETNGYTTIYPDNYPMPSRVKAVLVTEGAEVKKGQPLLEFDREMLILKVDEAQRGIEAAQAEVPKAEAAVRIHATEVASSEQTWKGKQKELLQKQRELEEADRLFKLKAINQSQFEAAESAFQAAEFNLNAAKIKLEGLRAESPTHLVTWANAGVKYKEALKTQAEYARDQLACNAPDDGRIIRSFVHAGSNFGASMREPAFWFLKKGPLLVRAEVTQEFAGRIAMGKSASIEDEADSTQKWKGSVTKVGDQFLPKRSGTPGLLDFMPASDDRVLECQITIHLAAGEVGPKFGQKVRVTLE
jgi:multidrug resistance efflux pump